MRAGQRSAGFDGARAWSALLAAIVILLQGLIPAAAIAHDASPAVQICTLEGVKLIAAPDRDVHKDHGFAGLACEQCVMASFAAVVDEAPAPPVRHALAAPTVRAVGRAFPNFARAPPRPPSTAPPAFA